MSIKRQARFALAGAAVALTVLPATPAAAGKPDRSGRTTTTAAGFHVEDGVFGGTVTATNTESKSGRKSTTLWVHAMCYQDGTAVFGQWVALGDDNTAEITLSSTEMWQGGAANCEADLNRWRNGRWQTIDSTTFNADAAAAASFF